MTLGRGDICRMSGTFQVDPMSGLRKNPDLKNLTVIVDGLARGGTPISRSAVLEWVVASD